MEDVALGPGWLGQGAGKAGEAGEVGGAGVRFLGGGEGPFWGGGKTGRHIGHGSLSVRPEEGWRWGGLHSSGLP